MGVADRQKQLSIFVIATLVSLVQGGFGFNFQGSSFPLPSELQCEGYPIVMRCPGTDVIQVVSAEYGRQNSATCSTSSEKTRNVKCRLPEAYDITSSKCNNKTQCKLPVTSENFPDPCPETHKYLQVKYRCVKYMFGCPGTLIGIGLNRTFDVPMRPDLGSWSKDPIYNPGHVFYVPQSQRYVQEYRNISDFVNGDEPSLHTLPSQLEGTSYVIYDGFMYYVKVRTRNIIKYGFMAGVRVKEGALPGPYSPDGPAHLNKVHLAVDEQGLWAVYAGSPHSDLMEISRINKDTLELEQTWKTTYSQSSCLHSFLICGVLYVVGSDSGEVDYMYNTNTLTGMGKYISIGFDQNRLMTPSGLIGDRRKTGLSPRRRFHSPAGLRSLPRSFRTYNFSSVMYNPRDRLLYAWEASTSKAVYYNLHFDSANPVKGTTTSTTTTRTSTTTSSTTQQHSKASTTEANEDTAVIEQDTNCPQVHQSGVEWPSTPMGTFAIATCPSSAKKMARWWCKQGEMTSQPQWDPQGPDMSDCDAWLGIIEVNLERGRIDVATAANQLSIRLSMTSQQRPLDAGEVEGAARLMRGILTSARGNEPPLNSVQKRQLANNIVESVDVLIKSEETWMNMDAGARSRSMDDIVTSMEDAGFLLVQSKSSDSSQDSESISKSGVFLSTARSAASSPHLTSPAHLDDEVVLPTADMSLNDDSFSAVFVFYDKLGALVDALLEGEDGGEWEVRSGVVSVAIGPSDHHRELSSPVKIVLETQEAQDLPRKCAFWKYEQSNGVGAWSTDGCVMTSSNASHTECSCSHVTSFAVLVNVAGVSVSQGHANVLNVITIVGISVSLVCLLLSIITFSCFRNIQSDRNTIHKHLCICLLAAEALFLFGINQTAHKLACSFIAGLLHYTFLAAFMWMALEGFQLYVLLIEVFEAKSRWKWYYLVGYGTPLVIVGVSAVVDSSGYGTENACWLRVDSGFIWSFVGPVCAVILFNLVFLGITVAKMYRHSQIHSDASKIENLKMAVRGAGILVFLLGITWAFGILWISESTLIMAYLFSVFNAFQGLFIFLFHCVFQRKVRSEYTRFFSRYSCCQKNSDNSYITNSMSFSKQYPTNTTSAPTDVHSPLQRMWDETRGNPSQSATLSAQDFASIPCQENSRIGFYPGGQNRSSSQLDRSMIVPRTRHEHMVSSSSDHELLHSSHHPSLMERSADVEDAYDHLQRHCHHKHDHPGHMDCSHVHHAGTRRGVGELPRRPLPQQPRSQTINPLHPARERHQVVDRDGHIPKSQKASTLANMQGHELDKEISYNMEAHRQPGACMESDYMLPIQPTEYTGCNKGMDRSRKPLHSESLHPDRRPRQRRSMASSGSDDPIVNDYSASSSAGSKPSSITGTISVNPSVATRNSPPTMTAHRWEGGRCPARYRDEYTERDENDLEVELLTETDKCHATKCVHPHSGASSDPQRDSAFYQSMPELDISPTVDYSPNSSHSSHDPSNSDELHHYNHHQRSQRSFDGGSKPHNRSQSDTRFNNDVSYANHPEQTHQHPLIENPCGSPDDLHDRAVMTSSCNYGNRYEMHQGIDASSRMMTCL